MRYVLERIRRLTPYIPQEASEGEIKLDAQENPYELPDTVRDKIISGISSLSLNRYPDPGNRSLKKKIAEYCGVDPAGIIVGNGSDELIQLILTACGGPGRVSVSCRPTFSMYRILSELTGTRYLEVPLKAGFELPVEDILEKKADLTFIASPNNPTGNSFPEGKLREVIVKSSGLVVIDEAYYEFSGKTAIPLLEEYGNLALLRTFSKAFSLAGIRAGYLIGSAALVSQLEKARLPYSFSIINQKVLEAVLSEKEAALASVKKILSSRDRLYEELQGFTGIKPYRSDANFILMEIEYIDGVLEALGRRNIKVRKFTEPLLRGFLRVTVGREEENRVFLEAVREVESEKF